MIMGRLEPLPKSPIPGASSSSSTVCIVAEATPAPSETFIRDHIERLPGRVVFLHGWMPKVGSRPALSLPRRLLYRAGRELLGHSPDRVVAGAYAQAFRKCRAAAVLAEYGPSGLMVLKACRRASVPLVVHFHGYDASVKTLLERYAEAYRHLFAYAGAIIAVSRAMEKRLVSLGAPAAKVHYNPCGIDCARFGGADPASAPPVFLAVGRLVEKKGPLLTLQAFASAHRAHPEARLRMIGDGPLLGECQALIQQLGLGEAVTMLGLQPHSVVQQEMLRARCFVQHSVEAASGDTEGTPVAVLEAGAAGLPVVSTRHGGIPDVVIEGETGLLVSEGDSASMARAMARIVEDPPLAGRLGAAARIRVEENFSVGRSLERLSTIIESCIRVAPK